MKRLATLALVVCFTAAPNLRRGPGRRRPANLEVGQFRVLAGALGYLIGKKGGPFFAREP